jgi:hypothetical protein
MDPLTIALAAVALLGTEATKTVGGKLGEGTLAAAQRLLELLRQKDPATAKRLEAADDPEVIESEVIEEVRRVAAQAPEVQAAINATTTAAQANGLDFQNLTQLAEKIGVVNLGPVQNQTNNINI